MQIQIQSGHLELTEVLRDHIVKRLTYSLSQSRNMVARIVVSLFDRAGPRGDVDKCCSIEVRLKDASSITIDEAQADIFVAIDRATERTGRRMYQRIARFQRVMREGRARQMPSPFQHELQS